MKKFNIMSNALFVVFLISMQATQAEVIINDTDNWSGALSPVKEGFTMAWISYWTQDGANSVTQYGVSSPVDEDFSPEIDNSGYNEASVYFENCGLWGNLGDCSDSMGFSTAGYVITSGGATVHEAGHLVGENELTFGNTLGNTEDENIYCNVNASIDVGSGLVDDMVEAGGTISTALTLAGLVPGLSVSTAISSICLSLLLDAADDDCSIYYRYTDTIDEDVPPDYSWSIYGKATCDIMVAQDTVYLDVNEDGVSEGTTQVVRTWRDGGSSEVWLVSLPYNLN